MPNAARIPAGCLCLGTGTTLAHSPVCGALLGSASALSRAGCALPITQGSPPAPLTSPAPLKLLLCFALQRSSLALEQSGGSLCSANSPFLLPFFTFPLRALKGKYKKPNLTWEQLLSSCCSQCQGCTWQLCTPGIPTPALPAPAYRGGSHAIQCVCSIYFSGSL